MGAEIFAGYLRAARALAAAVFAGAALAALVACGGGGGGGSASAAPGGSGGGGGGGGGNGNGLSVRADPRPNLSPGQNNLDGVRNGEIFSFRQENGGAGTLHIGNDGTPTSLVASAPNPPNPDLFPLNEEFDEEFTSSPMNFPDHPEFAKIVDNTWFPNLSRINADEAYRRGYFGQSVTVGIVDSGARISHSELTANLLPGYDFAKTSTVIVDDANHGTGIAGVIGAARNEEKIMGVAPRAKLLPLKVTDGAGNLVPGADLRAFEWAASLNAPILNNSYGRSGVYRFRHGGTLDLAATSAPLFPALLTDDENALYRDYFGEISNILAKKDMVLVWAAGNNGWSYPCYYEGPPTPCPEAVAIGRGEPKFRNLANGARQIDYDDWRFIAKSSDNGVTVSRCHSATENGDLRGCRTIPSANISLNQPSLESLAPLYDKSLLGKWVAVVAVEITENPGGDRIASYSNGCGAAAHWCIAAPGNPLVALSAVGDDDFRLASGSSFAAAHVSGALAVLRSRFPEMPMSAILAIMFKTARDMGLIREESVDGVDLTFGHGFLDLGAAITVQGDMDLVISGAADKAGILHIPPDDEEAEEEATSAPGLRRIADLSAARFPPGFFALRRAVADLPAAAAWRIGGETYYHDSPLSGLMDLGAAPAPALGRAAADMLGEGEGLAPLSPGFFAVVDRRDGRLRRLSFKGAGGDFRLRWRLRPSGDSPPPAWRLAAGGGGADGGDAVAAAPHFAADEQIAAVSWRFGGGGGGGGLAAFSQIGLGEDGDKTTWRQHGLRWSGGADGAEGGAEGVSGVGALAEFSRLTEEGSLLGLRGGALGVSGAQTSQARLRLGAAFGRWRWRGDWRRGWSRGSADGTGLVAAAPAIRYSQWRLEGAGVSVFRGGDELRLGLVGAPRARGKITLRRGRATGEEFDKELRYALPRAARMEETTISTLSDNGAIWRIGYKWRAGGRGAVAAAAAEYAIRGADGKDAAAAAILLRWRF